MTNGGKNPTASVIIVSWNVKDLLLRCLAATLPSGYEIIVVDNASSDGTPGAVRAAFPGVAVVESGGNLGFARACNLGARQAAGEHLIFLNPDTEPKPGALEKLVLFLTGQPGAAAAGAKLLWPEGGYQESCRRHPGAVFSALETLEFHYYFPGNYLRLRNVYGGKPFAEPARVDWLVGAAFAVRRAAFRDCGGFDENFFMYSEDADLCRRLGERGGEIWFVPAAEVVHHRGKSSEQSGVRGQDYFKSLYYYHRKHSGPAGALLFRAALACACCLRLAVLAVKFAFAADRAACLRKIKGQSALLNWSVAG